MAISAVETLDLALAALENVLDQLLDDCSRQLETVKGLVAAQHTGVALDPVCHGASASVEVADLNSSANPIDAQVDLLLECQTEQDSIPEAVIGSDDRIAAAASALEDSPKPDASEGGIQDEQARQSSTLDIHPPLESDEAKNHSSWIGDGDTFETLADEKEMPPSPVSHADTEAEDFSTPITETGFQGHTPPLIPAETFDIVHETDMIIDPDCIPHEQEGETHVCYGSGIPTKTASVSESPLPGSISCARTFNGSASINADDERQNSGRVPNAAIPDASPDDKENQQPVPNLEKPRTLQKPRVFSETIDVVLAETPPDDEAPIPKSYDEIIAMCRKVFRNPKTIWAHRCAAMDALSDYLKSSSAPTLLQDMGGLKAALAAQIEDSRSAVVRSVCRLIAFLAEVCTAQFEELAAFFLPKLLSRLYVTIRVVSSSADQCIKSMFSSMGPAAINLIPKLLMGLSDCHAAVRRGVCVYIRIVIDSSSTVLPHLEPHLSILCDSLSFALKDADRDVRVLSRKAIYSIALLVPDVILPNDVEEFDLRHRLPSESHNNVGRSEFSNLLK